MTVLETRIAKTTLWALCTVHASCPDSRLTRPVRIGGDPKRAPKPAAETAPIMERDASSSELPGGTVTFLVTDIEGSTRLLKQLGRERYGELLARHNELLRSVFEKDGGSRSTGRATRSSPSFAARAQPLRPPRQPSARWRRRRGRTRLRCRFGWVSIRVRLLLRRRLRRCCDPPRGVRRGGRARRPGSRHEHGRDDRRARAADGRAACGISVSGC